MRKMVLLVAAAVCASVAVTSASGALRPPYLTQAKPVYGVPTLQDGRIWTYTGDWVLAVFDYDTINGDPNVKRVPYTVCRVAGTGRLCVHRMWQGRPDIWIVHVLGWTGTRRYFDFTWTVGGKQRGQARVWVYE